MPNVNDKSKHPADWSCSKLSKELEAKNPTAKKYMNTAYVRHEIKRVMDQIKDRGEDFDHLIDKVVPGYSAREGNNKQRGLAEFCARLAREFNEKSSEVLDLTPLMIAGMVDAMDATPQPKPEPADEADERIFTGPESRLIDMLQSQDDMSIAGLAECLKRSQRTIERTAQTLIKEGYITRKAGIYKATKKAGKTSL